MIAFPQLEKFFGMDVDHSSVPRRCQFVPNIKLLLFASFLLGSPQAFAAKPTLSDAAAKFLPDVTWRAASGVSADFACNGRKIHAILGARDGDMLVAIFVRGLSHPPELLVYTGSSRDLAETLLKVEDLDFDLREFERDAGFVPNGLRRSKTCKGLNLSDGKVDATHIYFNREDGKFHDWSL